MVLELPLSAVEATHLQRDRMYLDPDDMASLKASIRDRGQQMPVEVVALADGRYGLVSGARRLAALTALHEDTGEGRFATVKALLRPFDAAPEAYLAMVEENEIRADLSFYERGRLTHEAARLGVFDSPAAAVRMLFQHSPAPKRSKILSFVALHHALGDVLRFPEAIPEKLGLALVKAMQDVPDLTGRLQGRLAAERPESASDERRILEWALRPGPSAATMEEPQERETEIPAGIGMKARPGRVVLFGQGVTEDFLQDLAAWLQARS
nr:ParB N-terminal domain-containing protein [Paracoccus fontiphilus]